MLSQARAGERTATSGGVMRSVLGGVRWGLDRTVSIGYGVVYDYIFDRFPPYQALRREVLARVESAVPEGVQRRDVRVLEVDCGPGAFSCLLAEAGFSVVGVDPYSGLIDLAREKRRAHRLSTLAFQHADLAHGNTFWEGTFDQVVSIHSLYAHPAPRRLLVEIGRILKPGGHLVLVNHTRRLGLVPTLRDIARRDGLLAALGSLIWMVPNAVFESGRKRVGPHYWTEGTFSTELRGAGFTVLEMRRTFLSSASLLVWARKDTDD